MTCLPRRAVSAAFHLSRFLQYIPRRLFTDHRWFWWLALEPVWSLCCCARIVEFSSHWRALHNSHLLQLDSNASTCLPPLRCGTHSDKRPPGETRCFTSTKAVQRRAPGSKVRRGLLGSIQVAFLASSEERGNLGGRPSLGDLERDPSFLVVIQVGAAFRWPLLGAVELVIFGARCDCQTKAKRV